MAELSTIVKLGFDFTGKGEAQAFEDAAKRTASAAKVSADKVNSTGTAFDALARKQDAAAQGADRIARAFRGVASISSDASRLAASIASGNVPLERQAALMDGLKRRAAAAQSEIDALYTKGEIGARNYSATTNKLSQSVSKVADASKRAADAASGVVDKVGASGAAFDALSKKQSEAAQAAERVTRAFRGVAGISSDAARLADSFARGNIPLAQQAGLLDKLRKRAASAQAELDDMYTKGDISARNYTATTRKLADSVKKLEDAHRGANEESEKARGKLDGLAATIRGRVIGAVAAMGAAFLAAFSVRAIASFARDSISMFRVQEDAVNRVRAAIVAQGGAVDELLPKLQAQASAMQAVSRFGDEQILGMQAVAMRMGVAADLSGEFVQVALDMASAMNVDVDTAMKQLIKSMTGLAEETLATIPGIKALTTEELKAGKAIDLVAERFKGSAQEDIKTFSGAVDQLSNDFGDLKEAVGQGLITGLATATGHGDDLGGAMRDIAQRVRDAAPGLREFARTLSELVVGALQEGIELGRDFLGVIEKIGGGNATNAALGGSLKQQAAEAQRRVEALSLALDHLARHGEGGASQNRAAFILDGVGISAEQTGTKVADLQRALQGEIAVLGKLGTKLKELEAQQDATGKSTKTLGERLGGMGGDSDDAKKKVDELKAALKGLADALTRLPLADALGLDLADEVAVLNQIEGTADGARETVIRLFSTGQISAEKFKSALGQIDEGLEKIRLKADGARASLEFIERPPTFGPEEKPELNGLRSTVLRGTGEDGGPRNLPAGLEAGPLGAERTGELVEHGGLDALEGGTLSAEALNVLIEDGEKLTEIIERATSGFFGMSAGAQAAANAMAAAQGKAQALKGVQDAVVGSLGQMAAGFVEMAISGEGSAKKLVHAQLKALATLAAQKAIESVATGLLALARHDPASASAAFAAAKVWGLVAIGAGVAAAATKPSEGASEGGQQRDVNRPGTGRSSDAAFRTTEREAQPAGPQISVQITGDVLAGDREELARYLSEQVAHINEQTGGRTSSGRL